MNGQDFDSGMAVTATKGASQLEAHVQSRLSGRVRDFRLEVTEKGLILRGRAPTYYAKQLAQHAVMAATRVPILANAIEVS